MLKRGLSFLVLIGLCAVVPSLAEDVFSYGHRGEARSLKPVAGHATLLFPGAVDLGSLEQKLKSAGASGTVLRELSHPERGMVVLRGGAAAEKALAVAGAAVRRFPVFQAGDAGRLLLVRDEIALRLSPTADEEALRRLAQAAGARLAQRDPLSPRHWLLEARTLDATDCFALLEQLARQPGVEWAEPNFYPEMRREWVPNDPFFPEQWHLENRGEAGGFAAGADVHAPRAWDISRGSREIVIAVIDDGLDLTHPDLAGNVWQNSRERLDGLDNDGNGYVDDLNGWDFYSDDNAPVPRNFLSEGHGTAVAGLAAAIAGNGIGVAGLAPRCRILPLQIFSGPRYAGDFATARALRYAAQHADVLNNSWSGGFVSQAIEDAILHARREGRLGRGCVLAFAAGNQGSPRPGLPARLPWVLGVGATDPDDRRSIISNHGLGLTLMAPQARWTTDIQGNRFSQGYNRGDESGDYTGVFGGTSAATPLAAAAAALVLSRNPDLSAEAVHAILQRSSEKIRPDEARYDATGFSREYGHGRLDAARALLETPTAPPLGLDDNFEPNDRPADAVVLSNNLLKDLVARDPDWFRLDPQGPVDLRARLYPLDPDAAALQLELHDAAAPNRTPLASAQPRQGFLEIRLALDGQAPPYYLNVRRQATDAASPVYALEVLLRPPDDPFEENDRFEDAAPIAAGEYSDLQGYDSDYYRLDAPPGVPLQAALFFEHALGDMEIEVYDQNGRFLDQAISGSDNEFLKIDADPLVRQWIVHVYGFDGDTNSYRMRLLAAAPVADDYLEDNDAPVAARRLAAGNYDDLMAIDVDWYALDNPGGQAIEIDLRFRHGEGDLDIGLYDSDLGLLASSTGTSDLERISLPAAGNDGRLLVHVYRNGEGSSGYALEIRGAGIATPPGPPRLLDAQAEGQGLRFAWSQQPFAPPARFLALVWDSHQRDWLGRDGAGGEWHPLPGQDREARLTLPHAGGYLLWLAAQYDDGSLHLNGQPRAVLALEGPPPPVLDFRAEVFEAPRLRLTWRPDFNGSLLYWFTAWSIPTNRWATLEGSRGSAQWQYVARDEADFFEGVLDVEAPRLGAYWFFAVPLGWDGRTLGAAAPLWVDVAP